MSLVISPKTTQKVIKAFTEVFDLRKIPQLEGKFWHGNFNDYLYEGLDGLTRVLFTGYSGAVVGQAILEYAAKYRNDDSRAEIYFVGSVYAFRDSLLEPGDLVFARDTYSPDSFEQSIYKNAKAKGIQDATLPDQNLLKRVLEIAKKTNIELKPTKVYCCITPGYFPNFSQPAQLMNEAMWWKLSLAKIEENGCDSGEYESASILATSRLLGIPTVALFDVKDKRYSNSEYKIANANQKKKALYSILSIIKKSISDS